MQGKPLVMLLVVLYASAFLAGFNENLVNMALVSVMGEYGVDSVAAQWLVTGYMIVATIMVMCMAFFYRRFKLRPLYFSAAAFTLVGSLMGLLAPNFELLMAARLVQAVGSGIFIPLMMNTVLVVTPKEKMGTFMSIGGCMITFGPALAPVVCGALVTTFGWHSIFAVPVIAVAVLAVLAIFAVKNLGFSPAHLDIPSVVLSAVFLSLLSFGLVELTIDTPLAVGALVVAVASAALFVWRQLRCEHPLIDLSPMKSRAFWPSVVLTTVAMMGSFSCSVLLPLYLESGTGLTAFMVGMVMLIPVLANAGTTLLGGRIMDARGEWPLLPAGFAAIAVGFRPDGGPCAHAFASGGVRGGAAGHGWHGLRVLAVANGGPAHASARDEPVRRGDFHHVRADRSLHRALAVHGHPVDGPGQRACGGRQRRACNCAGLRRGHGGRHLRSRVRLRPGVGLLAGSGEASSVEGTVNAWGTCGFAARFPC